MLGKDADLGGSDTDITGSTPELGRGGGVHTHMISSFITHTVCVCQLQSVTHCSLRGCKPDTQAAHLSKEGMAVNTPALSRRSLYLASSYTVRPAGPMLMTSPVCGDARW